LKVCVSEEYMHSYIRWCGELNGPDVPPVSEAVAEYFCTAMRMNNFLPDVDAICLHATAVEYRGHAYLFTAPSGYGKTTHARLWVKAFAPEARIINGDHPIVRWRNGMFYAYGTPFCGKEGYNVNIGVPVRGICYLTHSETNRIWPMDPAVAFAQFFYDTYPKEENTEKHMALLTRLVEHVPVYQLYCNQDEEAARVAYQGMQHEPCKHPDSHTAH